MAQENGTGVNEKHPRRTPLSSWPGVIRRGLALPVLWFAFALPLAGQTSEILGQVVREDTRQPVVNAQVVVVGTEIGGLTDDRGAFRLPGVPVGRQSLRILHIGYGERVVEVVVEEGKAAGVRIFLSETAIQLEAIDVNAISWEERRLRGLGVGRNVVTRADIEDAIGRNMDMAEVLRREVPNLSVRRQQNIAGSGICIELRTLAGNASQCRSPKVYLDGVPIESPTILYQQLDLRMIESMEVVSSAEAGTRYGSGALYGALLIQTRTPGTATPEDAARIRLLGPRGFDWSKEPRPHPLARTLAYSFVGSAAGLAIGLAAADQCIEVRRLRRADLYSRCEPWPTFGSAAAALLAPALASGLASGLGGRTDASRGRLVPAMIGASMALIPGYALLITSERDANPTMRSISLGIMLVGTPIASTIADRIYRKLRGPKPPPL